MDRGKACLPIWMAMERLTDDELIEMLPFIRDQDGNRVNLFQLKRYLKEKRAEKKGAEDNVT